MSRYRGRFAPSPTGALHAGSLVAALASWLDAKAHGGQWLVRIEDVDTPRCIPGADAEILRQLAACGLISDQAPLYQSQRNALYESALDQLIAQSLAYPCACSRKDIENAIAAQGGHKLRHGELLYPGTCRQGLARRPARSWRLHLSNSYRNCCQVGIGTHLFAIHSIANDLCTIDWQDRRLGPQQQQLAHEVGDFVLKRADGLWAYQLAVVVDDAAQGISHIVRGEDLADNTARQILLQKALGYPTPQYLHTPLILAPDGHKLSKQNGAQALALADQGQSLEALECAATALGLSVQPASTISDRLAACVTQWKLRSNKVFWH
jgi:glutamyl-Q tRNA(Asp) synthetase